ncbi:hypothetical protein SUDANB95_01537 [Actinosynnema sp. ALI-1.44]
MSVFPVAAPGMRGVDLMSIEGTVMGADDKLNNKAEEMKGRAKEALGDATDNEQWQAEGKAERAKGALKEAGEKVKDAFRPNDR